LAYSKRMSVLLFALALLFGGAVAQSNAADGANFVFRYKTGLTEDVAGDNSHDGVCEEGEDPTSPDCVDEEVPDEEETGEVVETVDPVPDWDNAWIGEVDGVTPLRISATTQKTDVGTSKVIYQCFKAEAGYGNYNWWIYGSSTDLPGFDLWVEKVDIVSRADLNKPLVNALFDGDWLGNVPMAPDPVGGRFAFTDEACVRIQVKEDAMPADDVVVNVMVDDYPDEDVIGGTMPPDRFWTADSAADFNVVMKPNCTSNCYPGDNGAPKVDTISIEMSTSNYGSEMSWNFSDRVARNDDVFYRCVKADGPNPYFFWKMTYDPTQQAPEYGGWIKGWDVVPRSQLSTPVAMTHQFEELGDSYSWYEYNHPVTTSDEACIRVKVDASALPAVGVTMDLRVDNTDNADGSMNDPDAYTPWRWEYIYINTTCKYGCRPPSDDRLQDVGFTFERNPNNDKVVADEGLSPLVVNPTTRQNHGDILYQCFSISGGFGNYQIKSTDWGGVVPWLETWDIVAPANVSQAMESDDPHWYPSFTTYGDTTTENSFCVRVQPRPDGIGSREDSQDLLMTVVDIREPNDGWYPDDENYQELNFHVFVTPEQEQADNNGDGICKFGETGSDCDGLCYPGEEGSNDCTIDPPPAGYGFGTIEQWSWMASPCDYGHDLEDPLCTPNTPGLPVWMLMDTFRSKYAVTYGGAGFSYQCFRAEGPGQGYNWWRYSVEYNSYGDPVDWLQALDIVPKVDLYGGTVAPRVSGGNYYPADLILTTQETEMCVRWIARQPAPGERHPLELNVFTQNYMNSSAGGDPTWVSSLNSGLLTIE